MSNTEVGDYTPIPSGSLGDAQAPHAGSASATDVPAASVREVSAAPEPEPVRYRYVARIVPAAYHIWEEVTGERVTTAPILGEDQAQETARQLNRINSPPR